MRSKNESHFGTILNYVNGYFDSYGRAPSTREIEAATGISRPTVQRYLRTMQQSGDLEYDGHRGIVTGYMREASGTTRVQMGNYIPCGPLSDVAAPELEHIRMPTALTGNGEFFLLRASGNSMINAGIDDGDLVLIKRTATAREGQIVAFLYDDEMTTLKRYKTDKDTIYLCPENDSMKPIAIRGGNRARLVIQGVATMVLKDL